MKSWRRLRVWILAADLVWATIALATAVAVRLHSWPAFRSEAAGWWPMLLLILLAWMLLFPALELDGFAGGGWQRSTAASQCLIGVAVLIVLIFAGGYAGRVLRSRLALGMFAALFALGLIAIRSLVAHGLRQSHRQGRTARTLVFGDGYLAQETVRRVLRHPELRWAVVGNLGLQPSSTATGPVRELGTLDLLEFVQAQNVDQVVLAMEEPLVPEIQTLLERLRSQGLTILQVAAPFSLHSARPHLLDLDGVPVICFEPTAPPPLALACKRSLDYAGALLGGALCLPLLGPLALLARLRYGRAFVAERRVGLGGREFLMWRLYWGSLTPNHGLWRWGFSEIPQFWNVLRGDMSLVGPRPDSPEVAKHYTEWQRRRLEVLPGMTGWAQVHGWRGNHREQERYSIDNEYVARWSLWRDMAILLQTATALRHRNRRHPPAADAGSAPLTPVATEDRPSC